MTEGRGQAVKDSKRSAGGKNAQKDDAGKLVEMRARFARPEVVGIWIAKRVALTDSG